MSLTQPFIDTISAFNATQGTNITLNILGGDAITSWTYSIYENSSNVLVTTATISVSGDATSSSIRSFSATISGNLLTNNLKYNIVAYTTNASGNSINSQAQIFSCYTTPSFSFKYYNGTSYVELTSSYVVPSPNLMVQIVFNKNDTNSNATLNYANLYLYGIKSDSTRDLVFSGDKLYSSPLNQTINNFSPTSSGIYTSYTLIAQGVTVEGMSFSSQITGLTCSYPSATTGDLIQLANLCSQGAIQITTSITETSTMQTLVLQYKENSSSDWLTILTLTKPSTTGNWLNFTMNFNYCGTNRVYNFRVLVEDSSSVVLTSQQKSVLCKFNRNFICDATTFYNTTYEYQLGSVQLSTDVSSYSPYGSDLPIVSKNALTKYRQAQTTALLLADTSLTQNKASIDRFAQVELVDQFNDWLANGKAKILKDFNGNLRMIAITSSISNDYYKELGNGIASTSFSWVEVGKFTQTYLDKLGMTNQFQLNYIS